MRMRTRAIAVALIVLSIATIAYTQALSRAVPADAGTSTVHSYSGDELVEAGLIRPDQAGRLQVETPTVRALLQQLTIDDRGTVLEYRRDRFGQRWADVDHNGCDTRNDVLRRDLTDTELKPGTHGCVVLSGLLIDPYTGGVIHFTRGQTSSSDVAVDHVLSLAFAWHHGAAMWTDSERLAFAGDPANLLAVGGDVNSSKSSRGPGEWLPPARAARCEFVTRYTYIAWKYQLSIGNADATAISNVLAGCSAQMSVDIPRTAPVYSYMSGLLKLGDSMSYPSPATDMAHVLGTLPGPKPMLQGEAVVLDVLRAFQHDSNGAAALVRLRADVDKMIQGATFPELVARTRADKIALAHERDRLMALPVATVAEGRRIGAQVEELEEQIEEADDVILWCPVCDNEVDPQNLIAVDAAERWTRADDIEDRAVTLTFDGDAEFGDTLYFSHGDPGLGHPVALPADWEARA